MEEELSGCWGRVAVCPRCSVSSRLTFQLRVYAGTNQFEPVARMTQVSGFCGNGGSATLAVSVQEYLTECNKRIYCVLTVSPQCPSSPH